MKLKFWIFRLPPSVNHRNYLNEAKVEATRVCSDTHSQTHTHKRGNLLSVGIENEGKADKTWQTNEWESKQSRAIRFGAQNFDCTLTVFEKKVHGLNQCDLLLLRRMRRETSDLLFRACSLAPSTFNSHTGQSKQRHTAVAAITTTTRLPFAFEWAFDKFAFRFHSVQHTRRRSVNSLLMFILMPNETLNLFRKNCAACVSLTERERGTERKREREEDGETKNMRANWYGLRWSLCGLASSSSRHPPPPQYDSHRLLISNTNENEMKSILIAHKVAVRYARSARHPNEISITNKPFSS